MTEAVNAGKIVTIPAENMTIGSWPGTGYMVIDPETGAGAYMISGGLNGGALSALLTLGGLCATFLSATATSMLVWAAVQFFALTLTPLSLVELGLSKSISSISATLNNSQIKYYVKLATKNKESDTCVLGTTGKYNVYASDNNYTYFIFPNIKVIRVQIVK